MSVRLGSSRGKKERSALTPIRVYLSADSVSPEEARMVTQRVPFGELYENSELSLPIQLTENAESVPLGVFLFSAFSAGV